MYKVPLTKKQKAQNCREKNCLILIKALTEKQKFRETTQQFADRIGISRATWSRWRGFYQPPNGKKRSDYPQPEFNYVIEAAHMAGIDVKSMINS